MDHLTQDKRSWNMSRIRSRHTKPELIIRSLLHRAGYRFKVNDDSLPGSPDIILPKYKTVIFVHGCFWHRHRNCPRATMPNTNREYWLKKLNKNVENDVAVRKALRKLSWYVVVVWECKILNDPVSVLDMITRRLADDDAKKYSIDVDRKQILKVAEKRSSYYLDGK